MLNKSTFIPRENTCDVMIACREDQFEIANGSIHHGLVLQFDTVMQLCVVENKSVRFQEGDNMDSYFILEFFQKISTFQNHCISHKKQNLTF